MALKRTCMPFYGKREAELADWANRMVRAGNHHGARKLYDAIRDGLRRKRKAHARIHH
jgi:hypothetical protein